MTDPTTVLAITGFGLPPYAARGLKQSLEPISEYAQLFRAIDGSFIDMSMSQFKKYKTTITGTDQQPPALDGVWPGQALTVDCISELAYETGSSAGPQRTVAAVSRTENGYTFYYPRLTMVLKSFSVTHDEYGAVVEWKAEMEEA